MGGGRGENLDTSYQIFCTVILKGFTALRAEIKAIKVEN